MAISTIYTFLMKSSDGTSYTKLVPIVSFPDLGAPPEQIDVTSLDDTMRHYVPGVMDTGSLQFEANYTSADYTTLKNLAGNDNYYAVWFGGSDATHPTGANGVFKFKGDLRVNLNGGGVNDPVRMTITIFPSTDITFSATSTT